MAGDGEDRDIDDVAALMEKLWGPREQSPLDAVAAAPPNNVSRLHRPAEEPHSGTQDAHRPAEIDAELLRRSVEPVVGKQLAALRVELIAAIASVEQRLCQRLDALAGSDTRNGAHDVYGKADAPGANGGGPCHPAVPSDVPAAVDGALSETCDQLDGLGRAGRAD